MSAEKILVRVKCDLCGKWCADFFTTHLHNSEMRVFVCSECLKRMPRTILKWNEFKDLLDQLLEFRLKRTKK